MRRIYLLPLHESINVKAIMETVTFGPFAHVSNSWVGMCNEIVQTLEGSKEHIVERHQGYRCIWRKGYAAPYFIEVEGGAFCCPWWV